MRPRLTSTFHVKRAADACAPLTCQLLANAEIPENHVEHVFHVDAPQKLAQRSCRKPQLLRQELIAPGAADRLRVDKARKRLVQVRAMALAGHNRGLKRKPVFRK